MPNEVKTPEYKPPLDQSYASIITKAKAITPLPPWHQKRQTMRLSEVPAYLKKMYNLTYSSVAVRKWVWHGVEGRHGQIHLKTMKLGRFRVTTKANVMAFLGAE